MKKVLSSFAGAQLSKAQMKKVSGGDFGFRKVCVDCYCSNGGGFGYTGGGNPASLAYKACGNSFYVCAQIQC